MNGILYSLYSNKYDQYQESTSWISGFAVIATAGISILCTYVFNKYIVKTYQLYTAVESNLQDKVFSLLNRGTSVEGFPISMFNFMPTPLIQACRFNHTAIANLLIENGANVNLKYLEWSPLHFASFNKNEDLVNLLIKHHADVHVRGNVYLSALHIAALQNAKKIAEILIKNGSNINALDNDNRTPLHAAAESNSKETINILLQNGANINAKNKDNLTPLHIATQHDAKEVFEILFQHKTYIDATLLHFATANNAIEIAKMLLLKYKVNINAQDASHMTPLHYASKYNYKNIVEFLIQNNADINVLSDGFTPLDLAYLSYASPGLIQLLKKNHAMSQMSYVYEIRYKIVMLVRRMKEFFPLRNPLRR